MEKVQAELENKEKYGRVIEMLSCISWSDASCQVKEVVKDDYGEVYAVVPYQRQVAASIVPALRAGICFDCCQ